MISISKTAFAAVLILLCILAAILAYRSSKDETSKFNFAEAFLDANGKTSMARVCTFVALSVSTWALVAMVQMDKLTEWFYTAYLTAFVINGTASKWIDTKSDKKE